MRICMRCSFDENFISMTERQRKRNRRLPRAKRQRSRREQNALSDRRGITDRTDMIDRIEMTETIGQTVPSVRIVQNALTVPKPVQRWSA